MLTDWNKQILDSNGNRVNAGNFDANGLNLNNWDDNRNNNIGLSASLHFHLQENPPKGGFSYPVLIFLIQPPNIRPISSTISWIKMYFLFSKTLISLAKRI